MFSWRIMAGVPTSKIRRKVEQTRIFRSEKMMLKEKRAHLAQGHVFPLEEHKYSFVLCMLEQRIGAA